MLEFKKTTLNNGLNVITYRKTNSNIVAVNVVYGVGSKHESENMTGIAHLLEHLMFGGSENVKSYDKAIQTAGGINNAYTTPDITSYYSILPKQNLETSLWTESDRMLSPNLDKESIKIQKKVVIEEFKERYLNKPYGEIWPTICKTAYQAYPYKWPTIGKEIEHIKATKQKHIKGFFNDFYTPNNATVIIAGDINHEKTLKLVDKWFGSIANKNVTNKVLPKEPAQREQRLITLTGEVPFDALYKCYHIPPIKDIKEHYTAHILTNILAGNKSSLLYKEFVMDKQYMNNIHCYTIGTHDYDLLIIEGKVNPAHKIVDINTKITQTIDSIEITQKDIEKAKNQILVYMATEVVDVSNTLHLLANAALSNTLDYVNKAEEIILSINKKDVDEFLEKFLNIQNCSTILYEKAAD
jgi:zinc protease